MGSLCGFFVKTVTIDKDENTYKTTSEVPNPGIKIRKAKAEELDRVADLLYEGYKKRLPFFADEGKQEFFTDMVKNCFQSNPKLIENVLVAIDDSKIQGLCSMKFTNEECKSSTNSKKCEESFKGSSCKGLMKTIFSFGMNQYLSKVGNDEAFIEAISVDPECKKESEIKNLLLQAAGDECQDRKCKKISSIVMFKDFENRRFFENYGYTTAKMHLARPIFMYGDKGCYKMEKEVFQYC
ncbi:DgyrCDS3202 [Dimorphilus gyrociliatus]|uniref:DgyrCDS3202 n=1 Tax=Dimorphilus gyrociliatus TaxID=2664684 RepID=A0A7I8VD25_9ANNE|nr:DgyrCDS3202 [Dimorphilus gyrociliatus]